MALLKRRVCNAGKHNERKLKDERFYSWTRGRRVFGPWLTGSQAKRGSTVSALHHRAAESACLDWSGSAFQPHATALQSSACTAGLDLRHPGCQSALKQPHPGQTHSCACVDSTPTPIAAYKRVAFDPPKLHRAIYISSVLRAQPYLSVFLADSKLLLQVIPLGRKHLAIHQPMNIAISY